MFLLVFNYAILLARRLSSLLTICAALIDDDLEISFSVYKKLIRSEKNV